MAGNDLAAVDTFVSAISSVKNKRVTGKDYFCRTRPMVALLIRWALAGVRAEVFRMSFLFDQLFTILQICRKNTPGVALVHDELSRTNFAHQYS